MAMDALAALQKSQSVPEIFTALLPGTSGATKTVREEAAALSIDLLARGALIIGAPGSGKSTLARAIGLARWANMLKKEALEGFMKGMRFDGPARLAVLPMEWYREVSLTGLLGTLADSQLFGIEKGAATDVKESRDGVFRLAMHGVPMREKQDPTPAAIATGGVVFLDEVGDLPPELQPKLLSVLSGAPVYPVGAEGDAKRGYTFDGLTIGATWRELDVLREDLVARFSDHIVRLPSLAERMGDLPVLVATISAEMQRTLEVRHTTIRGVQTIDNKVDHSRFPEKAPPFAVGKKDVELLAAVDWKLHGDLRGLTQVLRAAYALGIPISDAIARHRVIPTKPSGAYVAERLIERLGVLKGAPGGSFVRAVGEVEDGVREELVDTLKQRPDLVDQLAGNLQIEPGKIRRSYADLKRNRKGE